MTIFLTILAMFTSSVVITRAAKERKHREFIKFHKTNNILQYDIACNISETMAKQYRKIASTFSLDTYCPGQTVYLNKKATTYGYYKDIIKNYDVTKIIQCDNYFQYEMNWLITVALACGYSLKDNFMSKIYKEEIWENFPTSINDITISQWEKKYPNHIENLKEHLEVALWLKKQILQGKNIGCYEAYTNIDVLNIIASQYGLPTTYELDIMRLVGYVNLNNLICSYTTKELNKMGFNSAPLREINPNPTIEQKARQYAGLSVWETECLQRAEELKINAKICK